MNKNIKTEAERYTSKRLFILPLFGIREGICNCGAKICASPGKHPKCSNGLDDAINSPNLIQNCFSDEDNVALLTGVINGLAVFDVDFRSGGEESWKKLLKICPELNNAAQGGTGNGFHTYVKCDKPMRSRTGLLPGIDFKADRGYVVAPPSNHFSGKAYEWKENRGLFDVPLIDIPQNMLSLVEGSPQSTPIETVDSQSIPEGKRKTTLMSFAGSLRRRNFSSNAIMVAMSQQNLDRCNPPLHDHEIIDITKSVLKYPPGSNLEVPRASQIRVADLADSFVEQFKTDTDTCGLKSYRGRFLRYDGTIYSYVDEIDILHELTSWLQKHPIARNKISVSLVANLMLNIKAIGSLPNSVELPAWINNQGSDGRNNLVLKNGILDLRKKLNGERNSLTAHSSNFITTNLLPYEFLENAGCPIWKNFLDDVLPNREVQQLLQEWFGYNLVPDTTFGKFVLMVGEGANGKSVVVTVLRELLGESNVSSVALEGFDSKRTFPLSATVGKLANIHEDMNEIDRACEGLLKQYITGGRMSAERKHQQPFQFNPTARLTFATNVFPRFTDRTNGLWRRLIQIPFKVQITDEAKQDKRFIDPNFWKESGELSGIFNWALEGLVRLKQRGRFDEPLECRVAREDFQKNLNPHRQFLEDNYQEKAESSVTTKSLYKNYRESLADSGNRPLAEPQLALEVKRTFPNVLISKNALRQSDGARSRIWINLEGKIDDTGITDDTRVSNLISLPHKNDSSNEENLKYSNVREKLDVIRKNRNSKESVPSVSNDEQSNGDNK